jgi:molecular chaperone GrpE (heat shock protein)
LGSIYNYQKSPENPNQQFYSQTLRHTKMRPTRFYPSLSVADNFAKGKVLMQQIQECKQAKDMIAVIDKIKDAKQVTTTEINMLMEKLKHEQPSAEKDRAEKALAELLEIYNRLEGVAVQQKQLLIKHKVDMEEGVSYVLGA